MPTDDYSAADRIRTVKARAVAATYLRDSETPPGLNTDRSESERLVLVYARTTECCDPIANPGGPRDVLSVEDFGFAGRSSDVGEARNVAPGVPTIGNVSGNATSLIVAFTAPKTGVTPTSYMYELSVDGGTNFEALQDAGSASPFTISKRSGITAYAIRLTAVNVSTKGRPSAVKKVGIPGAPTNIRVTASKLRELTVSFTALTTAVATGGAPVTYKYALITDGVQGEYVSGVVKSPFTIPIISNGTTYSVKVAATNIVGDTLAPLSSAPISRPGVPTGLTATGGKGNLKVSFKAPAATVGAPITYKSVFDPELPEKVSAPSKTLSSYTINGLPNGTDYRVEVAASNNIGDSAFVVATAKTLDILANAPTIGTITGGNNALTVPFTAPTIGAPISGYEYQYSLTSTFPAAAAWTTVPGGMSIVSFSIGGLSAKTQYFVKMRAVNRAGSGAASASKNGTTLAGPPTVPGIPTIGTISGGNKTLTVPFTAPSTGGSPITKYTYTVSIGTTLIRTVEIDPPTPARFTIIGLLDGTTYSVTLAAKNSVGYGTASAGKSGKTSPAVLPGAPTVSSVTGGNSALTVAFRAPTSGGTPTAYKYQILSTLKTINVSPTFTATAPVPIVLNGLALSFTINTGLVPDTKYWVRVLAVNTAGEKPSVALSGITLAGPPTVPGVPVLGTVSGGNKTLSVPFTAPSNGGSVITKYTYTVSIGETLVRTVEIDPPTPTTFTIGQLEDNTTYSVTLAAKNSVGYGTASASTPGKTSPAARPGAPTIGTIVGGNNALTIPFTAPTSGGTPTGYKYQILPALTPTATPTFTATNPEPATIILNGSALSFTINTNLEMNKKYWVRVLAVNTGGETASSAASGTTLSAPPTVPGVPVLGTVSGGNKTLTVPFTAPTTGGSAITGYQYVLSNGVKDVSGEFGPTEAPITAPNTTPQYIIRDLSENTTYSVQLAAKNVVGYGDLSTKSALTKTFGRPGAPTINDLSGGTKSLKVFFTAPVGNGGSDITGYTYQVFKGLVKDISGEIDATVSPLTIANQRLLDKTEYSVQLAAKNIVGYGDFSISSVPRKTFGIPDAPIITNVTSGNATLTINFKAPTDNGGSAITGYRYDVSGGALNVSVPASASSFTIDSLINDIVYTISLVAVNATGPGTSVTIKEAPSNLRPIITDVCGGSARLLTVYFTSPIPMNDPTLARYTYKLFIGETLVRDAFVPTGKTSPFLVSGLDNGTTYRITMSASFNDNTVGPSSFSKEGTTLAIPGISTITSVTAGKRTLTFFYKGSTDGGKVDAYQYYYSESENGPWGGLVPPNFKLGESFELGGLRDNHTVYVFIRGTNGAGPGGDSNIFRGKTFDVPSARRITRVKPGNKQLEFFYEANDSSGAPITGYRYLSSTLSGSQFQAKTPISVVEGSSFTLGNLVDGTTYYARIQLLSEVGTGYESLSFPGTTFDIPSAPTITSVIAGNQMLTVAFDAPSSNGGSDISGYKYYISTNQGGPYNNPIDVSGSSPFIIRGLGVEQSYYVKLRAYSNVGYGIFSNTSNKATTLGRASEPIGVRVMGGNKRLTVSFEAPILNGVSPIRGYKYRLSPSGVNGTYSSLQIADVSNFSFSITTLPDGKPLLNNTPYWVQMLAVNDFDDGILSTNSDLTTGTTLGIASEPKSVSITGGNKILRVAFTAPDSNGGSPIIGYKYKLSNTYGNIYSPLQIADVSNFSFSITKITLANETTDLTDKTPYTVQMLAVTAVDDGLLSTPVTENTLAKPNEPSINSVIGDIRKLKVVFTAPNANGSIITKYNYILTRLGTSDISNGTITDVSSETIDNTIYSTLIIDNLLDGASYSVKLAATNSMGEGLPSNLAYGTTLDIPRNTGIDVKRGNKLLTVDISNPIIPDVPITGYTYILSRGGVPIRTDDTILSSPFIINDLSNGTPYGVEVWAKNKVGRGASVFGTGTPEITDPGIPTLNNVQGGNRKLTVNFNAPNPVIAPVKKYMYQLSTSDDFTNIPAIDAGTVTPNGTFLSFTISLIGNLPLANNKTYRVKVLAVSETDTQGTPTGFQSGTTLPGPVTLPPPTVTGGNKTLSIGFAPPASDPAITKYRYLLSTADTFPQAVWTDVAGLTVPFLINTNLNHNTTYYVKVLGVSDNGVEGDPSVSNFGKTFEAPGTPVLNPIVGGIKSLTVSFTRPTTGASISGYKYQLSTSDNFAGITPSTAAFSTNGTTISFNIGSLLTDRQYGVKVFAVSNQGVEGDYSAPAYGSTNPGPRQPFSLDVQSSANTLTVNFSIDNTGLPAITGYKYQLAQLIPGGGYSSFGGLQNANRTSSPITIGSLLNGTSYRVQILAFSDAGDGTISEVGEATTPLPAPTGVTVTSTTVNSFNVTITGPPSPITHYEYSVNVNGITDRAEITSPQSPNSIILSPLQHNKTHTLYLRAANGSTLSAPVTITGTTPQDVPPQEPILTGINSTAGGGRRRIFFNKNSTVTGSAIVNYQVFRSLSSGGPFTQLNDQPTNITNTTFDFYPDDQGAVYYVIKAVNLSNQTSSYSNSIRY
jgi:hypothetical protein